MGTLLARVLVAIVVSTLLVFAGVACTSPEHAAEINEALADAKAAIVELNADRKVLSEKVDAVLESMRRGETPAIEGAALIAAFNERDDKIAENIAKVESSANKLLEVKEKGGYSFWQMLGAIVLGGGGTGGLLGAAITRLTRGPSSRLYKDRTGKIVDAGRTHATT